MLKKILSINYMYDHINIIISKCIRYNYFLLCGVPRYCTGIILIMKLYISLRHMPPPPWVLVVVVAHLAPPCSALSRHRLDRELRTKVEYYRNPKGLFSGGCFHRTCTPPLIFCCFWVSRMVLELTIPLAHVKNSPIKKL